MGIKIFGSKNIITIIIPQSRVIQSSYKYIKWMDTVWIYLYGSRVDEKVWSSSDGIEVQVWNGLPTRW